MKCSCFDEKNLPPEIMNTPAGIATFGAIMGVVHPSELSTLETLTKLLETRESLKIGYKQLCLYLKVAVDIHNSDLSDHDSESDDSSLFNKEKGTPLNKGFETFLIGSMNQAFPVGKPLDRRVFTNMTTMREQSPMSNFKVITDLVHPGDNQDYTPVLNRFGWFLQPEGLMRPQENPTL